MSDFGVDANELLANCRGSALYGTFFYALDAECRKGNLPDEWSPLRTLSEGKAITFQGEIKARDQRIAELQAERKDTLRALAKRARADAGKLDRSWMITMAITLEVWADE